MITIGLVVTPGNGYQDVSVAKGTTLAQLVADKSLNGLSITVDGASIDPSAYASTVLTDGADVWATGGAKGA